MLDAFADLTAKIDWHADLKSGYQWDRNAFYADLPLYHVDGNADVKYPWELSRHQYFFDLAVAAIGGDDAAAQRVRTLWLDWIDNNPQYQGINWTSGLEAAMRSISWIWTLAVLHEWAGWQEGDLERITQSLCEHATYLAKHFSYYSSPFNHLIGEATALYVLSHVLAEHPQAASWRQQARKTLLTYSPRQFYDEGYGVEQAVSYHYYTLGFLTLAIIAARRFHDPLSDLEPVVQHAYRAGMPFRRPDNRWPAVGDLDSARALPVNPQDFWNFDGLCACGAVLFDDPDLIGPGAEPGAEVFWLFGSPGTEKWDALQAVRSSAAYAAASSRDRVAASPNGSTVTAASGLSVAGKPTRECIQTVMPQAGYVIASDGHDWMLFDAGSIAAGLFADATPSTAHGHADTLQVLYFADGRPLLDDSGIPFYNGNPDWIRYFRSPAAHNTVEIEGVEVVHPERRLAWSREVKRPSLSAELTDDAWMCGGKLAWPGVTWQRSLLCLPGKGLWIADQIETDRPRQAAWYWQLPAGTTSDASGSATGEDFTLCRDSSFGESDALLTHSQNDRPEGLRCHGYGKKSPGAVLVQRQRVEQRLLVLTSVGRANRPEVRVEWNGQAAGRGNVATGAASWEHAGCRWGCVNPATF